MILCNLNMVEIHDFDTSWNRCFIKNYRIILRKVRGVMYDWLVNNIINHQYLELCK